MTKSVYLDVSVLDLSKVEKYEIWSDDAKPKYEKKLCFIDKDTFIIYIKLIIFNKISIR